MNAIKEARQLITSDPNNEEALTLARLVLALESDADFALSGLYTLSLDNFALAMAILKEWRLDRYYARKGKLLDVSYQANTLGAH
ncbi:MULTISPECIES: hypothetical protein [unclassified Variovorax]|uniref:hypothetical protein n=1 Tax=unclassified Variovorax TaxID=663243 RepID=UPI003F48692A